MTAGDVGEALVWVLVLVGGGLVGRNTMTSGEELRLPPARRRAASRSRRICSRMR